jgi:F0F1-type ATP synthase membrane subunit b/b'
VTEIAQLRERAEADLATTRTQATADLTGEVSRLALGATEEVVGSTLDDSAQQRLIDDYIRQVGSQN